MKTRIATSIYSIFEWLEEWGVVVFVLLIFIGAISAIVGVSYRDYGLTGMIIAIASLICLAGVTIGLIKLSIWAEENRE